jgi:hypothetical protein
LKYNKLSTEQIEKIEAGILSGKTNTAIAIEVFGRKSMESSIRRYKANREALDEDIVQEEEASISEEQLEELCNSGDWSVANLAKRLRSSQRTNNQLRKVQRGVFDREEAGDETTPSLESILSRAVKSMSTLPQTKYEYRPNRTAEKSTLEVLLGDYQIGKLSRYYNTERAIEGMMLYGKGIIDAIDKRRETFEVERIAMAMLGDLVEDSEKHGIQSAISTDTGMSEQIHDAIESIWTGVIQPLAELRIPMDILCIVGNHGSSTRKGMGVFKEGLYSFDYIIHKTLESYCRIAGYDHVVFDIPEGIFGTKEIYGKLGIYEHGYTNAFTEKGMVDQMRKRGGQLEKHASYFRQADKHHHICYGQAEQVCNSAFFGVDQEGLEYSAILGFNSIPSQTIMFHVDDKRLGRSNVKDIVNIQVALTDKPV